VPGGAEPIEPSVAALIVPEPLALFEEFSASLSDR
jgi:hypothetical protein